MQAQTGTSLDKLDWGTRAKGDNLMASIRVEQVCQLLDKALEKTQ
ncbi:hypothetical protein JCM19236_5966 [Vibrio sp. JCM 19236]|nr:hypothetical protein JCM19236_5966 [Vibrio sp. JCM 19236]